MTDRPEPARYVPPPSPPVPQPDPHPVAEAEVGGRADGTGRDRLDPVRYGDWELNGIAVDF